MTFNKKEYQKHYRERHQEKSRAYSKQYYSENKEELLAQHMLYKISNPERRMWQSAKERAIKSNLEFTINIDDIIIPTHCKILGILLFRGKGVPIANSPSLDRIVPELGYIKGNIQVISYKANTMKSDATRMELIVFANWVMENYLD
jgi:hypothetical protein